VRGSEFKSRDAQKYTQHPKYINQNLSKTPSHTPLAWLLIQSRKSITCDSEDAETPEPFALLEGMQHGTVGYGKQCGKSSNN
jgi:hypothetical protein